MNCNHLFCVTLLRVNLNILCLFDDTLHKSLLHIHTRLYTSLGYYSLVKTYFISLIQIDMQAITSDEIICVQFSFCFLRLQFHFVHYVIVSCELPNDNSLDQRILLKN